MKKLQKYTNIAFLLLSVATIAPAYTNPVINEQEQVEQKETTVEQKSTETVWYKRPEVREKIGTAIVATVYITGLCAIGYYIFVEGILRPISKDPFNIRLMNANIEVKKLCQNYQDDLQMHAATVLELPTTHKNNFLKAVTSVYNKYEIKSTNKLYTLVDDSLLLNTNIF